MLKPETISQIREETLAYWQKEVTKLEFIAIAQGKEIGHKLADMVDEKTTALLTVNHITRSQCNSRGEKRSRSMGDLWLLEDGIYHAVNVKTGVVGREGQPNLVSMKKLLAGIVSREIDSYYLLIVKAEIAPRRIVPWVYFCDLLDWLDYVTFDSGPGQMMLKAGAFFAEYDPQRVQQDEDIKTKLAKLLALYEDGERRLRANRAIDLTKYREAVRAFMTSTDWAVTPETQRSLQLL